jgi:hypothetical protein
MKTTIQTQVQGHWQTVCECAAGDLAGATLVFGQLCRDYPFNSFRVLTENGSVALCRVATLKVAISLGGAFAGAGGK